MKRKLVKQPSGVYTLTIPKNIVEVKRWESCEFMIELTENSIIFTKINN